MEKIYLNGEPVTFVPLIFTSIECSPILSAVNCAKISPWEIFLDSLTGIILLEGPIIIFQIP